MEVEQSPANRPAPQPMRGVKQLAPGGSRARFPVRWAQVLPEVLTDLVWWFLLVLVILLMVS